MTSIKKSIIRLIITLSIIFSVMSSTFLSGCKDNTEEQKTPSPNTIKVLSYNVKVFDALQELLQTEISFSKRKVRLAYRVLEEFPYPDVIGLQEFTTDHMDEIFANFSGHYGIVTYYREGGFENPKVLSFGAKRDEASPILYRKDKFELVEHGCYWLSDTPDVVGSSTWGAEHVRICTWVRLKIIETGVEFVYYNTHLNWGEAQYKATILLRDLMPVDVPYFITGDFNLRPNSSNYALWAESMIDTRVSPINMAETPTSNGFDGPDNDSIIDYCFVDKENFLLISHKVLNDDIARFGEGKFASDHYAVVTEFEILR